MKERIYPWVSQHTRRSRLRGASGLRIVLGIFAVSGLKVGFDADAAGNPNVIYVDCSVPSGGDGSSSAPFRSITSALPVARSNSLDSRVTIEVESGICGDEEFPIQLNFPVRVNGRHQRRAQGNSASLLLQPADTLITRSASTPVPLALFQITGADVEISNLSLDGGLILPGDVRVPPELRPYGILARGAQVEIENTRIANVGTGVRGEGAGGRFTANDIENANVGMVFFGAADIFAPSLVVSGNTVVYRVNGLVLAGSVDRFAVGRMNALVWGNELATSYSDTGPSNPAAVRVSPVAQNGTSGHVEAAFWANNVRGTPKHAIVVHGGPGVARAQGPYTGSLKLTFHGTNIAQEAKLSGTSVITFTNVRATALPGEIVGSWEYVEGAQFDLAHGRELDDALVDHPEFDPVDGRELHNVLVRNGAKVDFGTFVVVP